MCAMKMKAQQYKQGCTTLSASRKVHEAANPGECPVQIRHLSEATATTSPAVSLHTQSIRLAAASTRPLRHAALRSQCSSRTSSSESPEGVAKRRSADRHDEPNQAGREPTPPRRYQLCALATTTRFKQPRTYIYGDMHIIRRYRARTCSLSSATLAHRAISVSISCTARREGQVSIDAFVSSTQKR
mgnify:CR=1 FL=1